MKIALIHHQYLSRGGMERYLIDLVKGFAAAGDEVTLITSKIDPSAPNLKLCQVVKNYVSLIPKRLRPFVFSKKLKNIIDKTGCDYSLSVARSVGQDAVVCGGTHIGFLKHLDTKPSFLDKREIHLEKRCYESSPMIIPHSLMMQNEIEEFYGIDKSKMRIIYPPVDNTVFYPELKNDQNAFKNEYGLSNDKTSLLFVSTGHKRKGLHIILKAMHDLDDKHFELAIAGSGGDSFTPSQNVRHLGYVSNIAKLYAAADLTLLPSQYEPFGLTAIESIQCGTPVLVSKHVGAGELLDNTNSIQLDNMNQKRLIECILKFAESKLTIDGDFVVSNKLTLEDHILKLREAFENVT